MHMYVKSLFLLTTSQVSFFARRILDLNTTNIPYIEANSFNFTGKPDWLMWMINYDFDSLNGGD